MMYNLYQTCRSNLGMKRIQRYKQLSTSRKKKKKKDYKNEEELGGGHYKREQALTSIDVPQNNLT